MNGEPLIPPAVIGAIVNGECGDPFAHLGMHRRSGALVVAAFLPEAAHTKVVPFDGEKGVAAEMRRIHPDGLFAVRIEQDVPFPYRFLLQADGRELEIDDPYRFPPILGEQDVYLLAEGTHMHAYEKLGAHCLTIDGVTGVGFVVWAPNAMRVSVVGDFNSWDGRRHPMRLRVECGVWELFIPGTGEGAVYKYEIRARDGEVLPLKSDPFAFRAERSPATASIVFDLNRRRGPADTGWTSLRQRMNRRDAPISIYEVHLGSWRRKLEEGNRYLTYGELADRLVPYVKEMGFTHVELLPTCEYPFDGSWGYQPTGLYAPTSRFGTPDEFRKLVGRFHQEGIAVLIDWVPGHFPSDAHGLARFDGTALYEHADPRKGLHQDWDTLIYNYGRNEVANFLLANAIYWIREHGVDGLRVDAVASMLYLDYSRAPGEWIPNEFGGRENLEAIRFLRRMNEIVFAEGEGSTTAAEESTDWPMVSRPTYLGGLGFGYKWNMGWMHDTLNYMSNDPIFRRYHHDRMTFGLLYAFSENFILPLSHDEVVHGKGSLLGKMPGDRWQRFANLRAYFAYMWTMPGKKLLFMGGEFGQEREWNHDVSLDWHLLDDPMHQGVKRLVADLNRLYREHPALHELDCEQQGFEWIDCHDVEQSVFVWRRLGRRQEDEVVVVANFTPVVRSPYRIGLSCAGPWRELLNTDALEYGGSGVGNSGQILAEPSAWQGRLCSAALKVPPLAALVLAPVRHA
ncbi:MAG TPA: 1,4-alpha-glucan branching protein GlgB [Alphaproteobacteria bacterium]|nr:1,4-alpha-glucan branching protein GlgB [Alphaproteobacteria bacterium]